MAVTINGTTGLTANGSVFTDASGNVGIGTSSPGALLQLNRATGASDIRLSVGGTLYANIYASSSDTNIFSVAANPLIFGTNNTERMRIDSSGNLLVGTTTPNGLITAQFDGLTKIGLSFNDTSTSGTTQAVVFRKSTTTQVGSIQTSTTATSYVTSSDYRLKESIAPITGALDKVQALKPVTYKWKIDGSDGQGFIAHELQAVVPDCVIGEKDAVDVDGKPVYQGIDTSFLVATLTAAIQEQQALITALTARITALEAQNADNPRTI